MSDGGLSFTAELKASIDGISARLERDWNERQRLSGVVRQASIMVSDWNLANVDSAGYAVLRRSSQLGPPQGFYWSVRRLTAYGFTAGTVTATLNSRTGEPLIPWPQEGVFTFGKGELLLHPGSQMVFSTLASGLTGTVQIYGAADVFESWYLPYYIG
jgi:hypothetical protein